MSDDADIAADLRARDILTGLRELKDMLARLERLMEQIALGLGVRPHG